MSQLNIEISTKKWVVILVKPSSYHKRDQFALCGLKQGIPSNSLTVMRGLTQDALKKILPENVKAELHVIDEGIFLHAQKLKGLKSRFPEKGTKVIVGLVGVQTSQFERARHLAYEWQSCGATVIMGGFHVTTAISTMHDGIVDKRNMPCPKIMPQEIKRILKKGVIVFHGEAEKVWEQALADIVQGNYKLLYRGGIPDLSKATLSTHHLTTGNGGYVSSMKTYETGRGCPFTCSFCSIINRPGGRSMRFHNPEHIVAFVKELCEHYGRAEFFVTDDNFARCPYWEAILDGLIALRRKGYKISFMVEADLACGNIPYFLEKLATAGCWQIFMGVESMNPKNLQEAHKWQNQVSKYENLWHRCHVLGLSIHAGYIIGFPHDTPLSVIRDIHLLKEAGADIASFFMLTPVPGSEDHIRAVMNKVKIDQDLNKYDSFEAVMNHPLMSRKEWKETYDGAWKQFYSIQHMQQRLKKCKNSTQRKALQRVYMWYCWAIFVEGIHPMNSPFLRVRLYRNQRPGVPKIPYLKFLWQESWRYLGYVPLFLRELYRFQQVNLPIRKKLNEFWKKYASKKWRLLLPWNWHWHFRAIPQLIKEAICWPTSLALLPT